MTGASGPFAAADRLLRRSETINPFDSDAVARRYARSRPYYHPTALELAASVLGRDRAEVALDVGCGTGLSSRAVRQRADRVIAVDVSSAMLRAAETTSGVSYVAASAEQLPLSDGIADLATIAAAFHWFDQAQAIAEVARVLRPAGALIVYTDGFTGQFAGNPAFSAWVRNTYLPRLPAPARGSLFDPDTAQAVGFNQPSHVETQIQVPLTPTQITDYLLTQSNAATAISTGAFTTEELRTWIDQALTAILPRSEPQEATFKITIWAATLRP